jgi:excisionase family DNA binding protein
MQAPAATPIERLTLRLNEVAATLGLSRRTVERLIYRGKFPPPDRRAGRALLWRVETIDQWVASN